MKNTNPPTERHAAWRVAIYNLGCRVNRYESDAVTQQLKEAGFAIVDFNETADLYIVNTCAVTAEAARKSGQFLRRAKKLNPHALVVAMGCLTALEGEHKNADLSIGNKGKSQLAAQVLQLMEERSAGQAEEQHLPLLDAPLTFVPEGLPDGARFGHYEEYGPISEQSETRAFVKIQDGCNQFCAYCTIPLARGRVCSREESEIIAEVEALVASGYREITLTGIHVCSYGADFGLDSLALMDLCDKLAQIDALKRIRFGSVEPLSITPEFIARFAKNDKLCRHLHLSLQSGSERTLHRMRRNYTARQFRAVVDELRRLMPEIGLTTDLIVAFPGETEAEHRESLDFCEQIGFSHMHIFRYSPRPLTAAAKLPDQVPGPASERRAMEAQAVSERCRDQVFKRFIHSKQEVLLEQEVQSPTGAYWTAYTGNYLPLRVELGFAQKGEIITVEITGQENDVLIGKIIR